MCVLDAVRRLLYPGLTVNGFTPQFEEAVLQSAAQPIEEDEVWETEEDIDTYFRDLKKRVAA